jgi:hypothetical protein
MRRRRSISAGVVLAAVYLACARPNPGFFAVTDDSDGGTEDARAAAGVGGLRHDAAITAGVGGPADAASPDRATSPLARGLVGYWPLDDAVGSVARDRSGNGNDGVLTAGLDPASCWSVGKIGGAVSMPATDHAGIEVAPSGSLDRIATAYTMAAWMRRAPNQQTSNPILSRHVAATVLEHYELSISDGHPSLHASHLGMDDVHFQATVTVMDGKWQHIVGTFDGQTLAIYVDGQRVAARSYPGPVTHDGAPLYIGNNVNEWMNTFGQSGVTNQFMVGDLDEVVLYDRALGTDEIAMLAAGARPL